MLDALARLDSAALRELAAGLRSGRLTWPNPHGASLASFLSVESIPMACEAMEQMHREGFSAGQAGLLVGAMVSAQEAKPSLSLDLVWTGPDMPLDEGRSTLPVVNELFLEARERILITGYALYDGKRIFKSLIRQLQTCPNLEVTLVLNISRKAADTSSDSSIVSRWARDFIRLHWKYAHLPKVFFDPRSLNENSRERAVMHAKCIIVDGRKSLISSANLTEAAQRRNIETGLLVSGIFIAKKVEDKFKSLIQSGYLLPVRF